MFPNHHHPPPHGRGSCDFRSPIRERFLRPLKPYKPPQDASERLDKICQQEGISSDDGTGVTDLLQRFQLFTACEKEFEYSLPNSLLTSIETIGDLRNFYKTPVNTTVPLDALRNEDLPKNLHVQYDYIRFHPDTDQLFDGKTAFPKSSTIVTGLKYRKKYPGHKQQDPWKI